MTKAARTTEKVGENRFSDKNMNSKTILHQQHPFDYFISESKLKGRGILLDYSRYQGILSPWKSMKDEVRILRRLRNVISEKDNCDNNDVEEITILLGVGSMAWSGGFLNCQPFCLVRL